MGLDEISRKKGHKDFVTIVFEAKRQINAWKRRVKKSNLTCFDGFLSTLTKWEKEILNYFDDRHTSGFVEGLRQLPKNKIPVSIPDIEVGHSISLVS